MSIRAHPGVKSVCSDEVEQAGGLLAVPRRISATRQSVIRRVFLERMQGQLRGGLKLSERCLVASQ